MGHRWTEVELAYFAGLIDGEGCFHLHPNKNGSFCCTLAIGNTDWRMLEWVQQRFGGSVKLEKRNNAKHKPVWRWASHTENLTEITQAVRPYLVAKKDRADLFLAYRATLPPRINTKRSTNDTSEHVKQLRRKIHVEMTQLNKRGIA